MRDLTRLIEVFIFRGERQSPVYNWRKHAKYERKTKLNNKQNEAGCKKGDRLERGFRISGEFAAGRQVGRRIEYEQIGEKFKLIENRSIEEYQGV